MEDSKIAAVALYDENEATILKVKEQVEKISISGPDDKTGYDEAKGALKVVSAMRIAIEKRRKALGEESLRRTQAINGRANELKSLIEPMEEKLSDMVGQVDAELKKRKLRAEREAILPDRRMQLNMPGRDSEWFTDEQILDMDDAKFYQILSEKEAERARVAEAENQRIRDEQAKIEAEKKRQLEIQEAVAKAEAAAVQAERDAATETIGEARIASLTQMGLRRNDTATKAEKLNFGAMAGQEYDLYVHVEKEKKAEQERAEERRQESIRAAQSDAEKAAEWARKVVAIPLPEFSDGSLFTTALESILERINKLVPRV